MRRYVIAIKPERYSDLIPEIDRTLLAFVDKGWQGIVLKSSATSGYQFRADLAALNVSWPFDHLGIIGNLPMIPVRVWPDGHPEPRELPAVQFLVSLNPLIDSTREPATVTGLRLGMGTIGIMGGAGITARSALRELTRTEKRLRRLTTSLSNSSGR